MHVEISTNRPTVADEQAEWQKLVETRLNRFSSRLTRCEVHVNIVGSNAECRLEARPAGRDPVAVTATTAAAATSVRDATVKLSHMLDTLFGKADSVRSGPSASGLST